MAIPLGVLLLLTITWPLRDIALVYWLRGSTAYRDGIRVLSGKPTRFSDGQLVPDFPDFITGLAAFVIAMSVAIVLFLFATRLYERICSRTSRRAA